MNALMHSARATERKRMEKTIEELIYEETDQRLKEMGKKDYVFPKKANKADYIGIVAAAAVSILLIVLCMTGVIV